MEEKNIGVVEFFDAASKNEECGFIKIKFTWQFAYLVRAGSKSFRVYISRSEVKANNLSLEKGNVVCFDIIEKVWADRDNYHYAENIRLAESDDFFDIAFVADEKNYFTLKKMDDDDPDPALWSDFFSLAIFDPVYLENFSWIRDDFFYMTQNNYIIVDDHYDDWSKFPKEVLFDPRMKNSLKCLFPDKSELEKYFQMLLEDYSKNPSPEIADIIKAVMDFGIDIENVIKNFANLSFETVLLVWEKFNPVQKWKLFEEILEKIETAQSQKLFDALIQSSENIVIEKFNLSAEASKKFSKCVAISKYKVPCAEFLLNNLELLKTLDVDDETLIFLMYAAAKENKISREFLDILGDKNQSPRVRIVYHYLCAGFYKANGEIAKMQEKIKSAAQIFVDIFTIDFDNPENFPELHHVLPGVPPTDLMTSSGCPYSQEILYCESKKWNIPKKDNFGKYLRDENGELIIEKTVIYCPRLRNNPESSPKCAHLYPNLNLPINKWSIIELVKKLELDTYEEHFQDGEYFNYIGASFNRLWELRERLKCRVCGEYMKPAHPAKFRKVMNIGDLTNKYRHHHAVLGVTVFHCKNEHDDGVYLSYCWHCNEIIDSRDTPVQLYNPNVVPNPKTYNAAERKFVETFDGRPVPFYANEDKFGFYSCIHCGAGYMDPDRHVLDETNEIKYAVLPGTICPKCTKCPKCGCQKLSITKTENGFKLKCRHCGEEFFAQMMLPDSTNKRKFTCADENCRHTVYLERDLETVIQSSLKWGYTPVTWAKEISIKKDFESKPFFDSYEEWKAYNSKKSN